MKKVIIYTDGACSGNPGPGGYGAIIKFGDIEKEISGGEPETTNNRMELLGPIAALSILKEPCNVTLYSDSSYVVNSFNEGWIFAWKNNGWKRKDGELKNIDLIKKLYDLCLYHKVTWVKVKGHADNEYNNRCDALAVAASHSFMKEVRDEFYEGDLEEKATKSVEKFKGKVFSVNEVTVTLPDGNTAKRDVVKHNGGSAIVAFDDKRDIYLVRQYRIAAETELLEIPAGKLEAGEDPKSAALRELTEETGAVADSCEELLSMFVSPGYCSEKIYIYLCHVNNEKTHPHRDEEEFLHVVKMPYKEAYEMARNGRFADAKTVAGILASFGKI